MWTFGYAFIGGVAGGTLLPLIPADGENIELEEKTLEAAPQAENEDEEVTFTGLSCRVVRRSVQSTMIPILKKKMMGHPSLVLANEYLPGIEQRRYSILSKSNKYLHRPLALSFSHLWCA